MSLKKLFDAFYDWVTCFIDSNGSNQFGSNITFDFRRQERRLGSYERSRIALDVTKEDKLEKRTITLFLFTTAQMELQPRDAENPEARWVDREEVTNYLTHKKDKNFFKSVLPEINELYPKHKK